MQVTSISDFRKDTKKYLDRVVENRDILIIARGSGQSVVTMSLDDYNSLTETDYLLSNPVNADRLKKSLRDAKAGKVSKRKLTEI